MREQSFESKLLRSLSKEMGLIVSLPHGPTRSKATLDFLLTGSNVSVNHHNEYPSPSDHQGVLWNVTLQPLKRTKSLKIPDREIARGIMTELLDDERVVDSKSFLLQLSQKRSKLRKKILRLVRHKRSRNLDLFNKLLEVQEPTEMVQTINDYWKKFWSDTEDLRYSQDSKSAYKKLKTILKYHLFQKRDGGLINALIRDDGSFTEDSSEVDKQLLETIREIQVDESWGWLEKKPFPKLKRINQLEAEKLISTLSTGKAIAFDAASDILFDKSSDSNGLSNAEKTAKKLHDIWRVDLDKVNGMDLTWDARLIPLNKVFPQTPNRTQLRPILAQSALVKLIESRFVPKLTNYLNKKLNRAQVGFVKGLGIQVNLARALRRIKYRAGEKRASYGVFIDFSQAYNSIPHTLLFQKLREKQIFEEDELAYLEQLYCRYTLKIGKSKLRYNKGVAQGSILSPALFDIFIEDLGDELQQKADMNIEDLLFYADDILMLCSSPTQAENCIRIVEEWSVKNGMELNKNKSGIVIFSHRHAKKVPMMKTHKFTKPGSSHQTISWQPSINSIRGIPICESYKYLGTYLTPKLSSDPQLMFIKRKSAHLFSRLYPYLANASADARRDMWQTMVAPLFNAVLTLLHFEPSRCHRKKAEILWRGTFKEFLLISKRTNSILVDGMINRNLRDLSQRMVESSLDQWEKRKHFCSIPSSKSVKCENGLRGVPNIWCKLVNTQVRPCPICKKPGVTTDRWHLKYHHCWELPHINRIWKDEILPISRMKIPIMNKDGRYTTRLISRQKICEMLTPIIKQHLANYNEVIANLARRIL